MILFYILSNLLSLCEKKIAFIINYFSQTEKKRQFEWYFWVKNAIRKKNFSTKWKKAGVNREKNKKKGERAKGRKGEGAKGRRGERAKGRKEESGNKQQATRNRQASHEK
jgi:hypothetical protein